MGTFFCFLSYLHDGRRVLRHIGQATNGEDMNSKLGEKEYAQNTAVAVIDVRLLPPSVSGLSLIVLGSVM